MRLLNTSKTQLPLKEKKKGILIFINCLIVTQRGDMGAASSVYHFRIFIRLFLFLLF